MEWYVFAIALFATLLVLLATGLPVAFSLGLTAISWLFFLEGGTKVLQVATVIPFQTMNGFTFTVLPMFIVMAEFLMFTGISADLFDTINKWIGRLPGGLAISSIYACAGFASICGGSVVTAVAIGKIAVPEMLTRGYDKSLATGCVACAGTLGILIPPSAIMIFYAIATETPLGELFIAGVFPGIILATMFATYVFIRVKVRPDLAPQFSEKVGWRDRFSSLRKTWSVILLVIVVLGSIYAGVASATEAGAVGAFGAFILSLVYRKATPGNIMNALLATVRTTSFVALIVVSAMLFGFVMSYYDVASHLASLIVGLQISRWLVIALIMLICIFLGMFLEPASIIFISMPIFFPIIKALGFDPVWFGILMTVNMEIANMTPPVGLNVYAIAHISQPFGVTMQDVFRGAFPFTIIALLSIVLLSVFPEIALWLPSMMRR